MVMETTLTISATIGAANNTSFFVDRCRADDARRRATLRRILRGSPHLDPICVLSLRCNTSLFNLRVIRARGCASFLGSALSVIRHLAAAPSTP
jgi:hypothetical protein